MAEHDARPQEDEVRVEHVAAAIVVDLGQLSGVVQVLDHVALDVHLAGLAQQVGGQVQPSGESRRAEVRQVFMVPKLGLVAGCAVVDGKILRGANVRLLRDSRVVFDGKLSTLKRFKDDAKEVAEGFECGMGIEPDSKSSHTFDD